MQTRILTIVYKSNIPDAAWAAMVSEIVADVEQQACDYAAREINDRYEVDFFLCSSSIYSEKGE